MEFLVNIKFQQIETYLMDQQKADVQNGRNGTGELTGNCENAKTSQPENSTAKIFLIGLLRISCCQEKIHALVVSHSYVLS